MGTNEQLNNPEDVRAELTAYITFPLLPIDGDALEWWRQHKRNFPGLARLAMAYLGLPATSAAVERFFSGMGIVVTALRACLSSRSLEELVYLKLNWDDSLYAVDYHIPANAAEEKAAEDEPDSEGEDDFVNEDEEEEEAEPDFEALAAELAQADGTGDDPMHGLTMEGGALVW